MSTTPATILGKIGKKVGEEVKTVSTAISTHSGKTDNPHNVTKTQVGLGNVDDVALSTWAGTANITTVGTLSSGTVPYSLLSGVPDVNNISGNLTIGGNLTVGGQTTTLNTETVLVEDNIIELNMKSDGAETAQTSGIQVNRGVGLTEIEVSGFGKFIEDIGSNYDLSNTINGGSVDGKETYTLEGPNPQGYKIVWFSNPSANNSNGDLDTTSAGWVIQEDNGTALGLYQDFSGGSENLGNGSTANPASGITITQSVDDKATIIWDDNSGQATWKFGLGTADADIKAKDVVATGVVKVPSGNGLKINDVSIGDYALFESALNTAKS